MNYQNLKPFNTWDAEAHRAISSKAGKASGLARRRKAAIRRIVEVAMAQYEIQKEIDRLARNEKRRKQRALNRERTRAKAEP